MFQVGFTFWRSDTDYYQFCVKFFVIDLLARFPVRLEFNENFPVFEI